MSMMHEVFVDPKCPREKTYTNEAPLMLTILERPVDVRERMRVWQLLSSATSGPVIGGSEQVFQDSKSLQ
jgi:hypothetical protein